VLWDVTSDGLIHCLASRLGCHQACWLSGQVWSGPVRMLDLGQGLVSHSASQSASWHLGGQVRSAGIRVRVWSAIWHPDQLVGIHGQGAVSTLTS